LLYLIAIIPEIVIGRLGPRRLIVWHNYGTLVSMLNALYVTRKESLDFDRKVSAALRTAALRKVPLTRALPRRDSGYSPDLVVASMESGHVVEIVGLRQAYPKSLIVVAIKKFSPEISVRAYRAGATAVVPLDALGDALANLTQVLEADASNQVFALDENTIKEFHNEATGRLDAHAVARGLGVSVAALAKSIKLTPSALSKRPHAKAAQEGLRQLEFVMATLRRLLGSDSRTRAWLNAPHADLDGQPPIALLTKGSARELADYVRSVLAGQPT
jgi:uncharacterized protein (DUF2384 family)